MARPTDRRGAAASMGAVALVRIFFGALVLVGFYLTYVGWIARNTAKNRS